MSKSSTTSKSTTESRIDPYIQGLAYDQLRQGLGAVQGADFVPQAAPVAFTPDQQTAFGRVRDQATNPVWGTAMGKADASLTDAGEIARRVGNWTPPEVKYTPYEAKQIDAASGRYNYTPETISEAERQRILEPMQSFRPRSATEVMGEIDRYFGGAPAMSAAQVDGMERVKAQQVRERSVDRSKIRDLVGGNTAEALPQYLQALDPTFYQALLDPTLKEIERQRQIAQVGTGSQAAQMGAFGGSRQAVMEAETNRAAMDQVARSTADAHMQRLNAALAAIDRDFGRSLQAQTANQGMDYNALLESARLGTQADQFNSDIDLRAQTTNAQNDLQRRITNAQLAQDAARTTYGGNMQLAGMRANAALQAAMQADQLGWQRASRLSDRDFDVVGANLDARNRAGAFNAGQNFTVDSFNAGQQNTLGSDAAWKQFLAGQQNVENAAGANRDALAAGALLTNVGNSQAAYGKDLQGLFTADTNALLTTGGLQQEQAQKIADTAASNAQMAELWPVLQAQMGQAFINQTPYGTTTTSSGKVTQDMTFWDWMKAGTGLASAVMSDERLKHGTRPVRGALERTRRLKPSVWEWNGSGNTDAGLTAQSVRAAIPEATRGGSDAPMSYELPRVVGLLAGAVQELDQKVSGKRRRK